MGSQLLVCRRLWARSTAAVLFAIVAAVASAETPKKECDELKEAGPDRPLTRVELDCLVKEAADKAKETYGEADKSERRYLPIFRIDLPLTDKEIRDIGKQKALQKFDKQITDDTLRALGVTNR